jgi:hypothetical protein
MKSVFVRFSGVDELPDSIIPPGPGPAALAFRKLGLVTVRDAALWLRGLSYGSDPGPGQLRALASGFGDCTSKHLALLDLTRELGADVGLIWGVYPLDADLVPAVGPVLAVAGLPFVPNIHCFLQSSDRFVDLTEGNCTGKSRQVEHYLALFPARPGEDETPVREAMARLLTAADPRFSACSTTQLLAVTTLCLQAKTAACGSVPTGQPGDGIGLAG